VIFLVENRGELVVAAAVKYSIGSRERARESPLCLAGGPEKEGSW